MSNTKQAKLVVFELVDKQNSSFLREGTTDDFLNSPATKIIPSISVEVLKSGEHQRLRYIKGCSYLEVKKQIDNHINPSTMGADTIAFDFGKLILVEEGDDKVKIDFLRRIVLNIKHSDKKSEVSAIFREVDDEKEAELSLEEFFTNQKVTEYLSKVAVKDGDKIKYKEEEVDYLCKLFGMDGFGSYDTAVKFKAIHDFGFKNPTQFLKLVADAKSGVYVTVKSAIELRAAEFVEPTKFGFVGGRLICTVKESDDDKEKLDEVVEALMSSDKAKDLAQLEAMVQETKKGKK